MGNAIRKPQTEQRVQGSTGMHVLSLRNGQVACDCKGFFFRGTCSHLAQWTGYVEPKTPRKRIKVLTAILSQEIIKHARKYEVAGSYRREKQDIRDIDILVQCNTKKWELLRQDLQKLGVDFFATGEVILRGNFRGVQVDFYRADPDQWATFLLFLTGSGPFNIAMRVKAKRKGYKLNQYGLYHRDTGEKIPTPTEAAVFAAIDMPYAEPEERDE